MSNYKQQPKVRIKETGEVKLVDNIDYEFTSHNVCTTDANEYTFDEVDFITPDHYANIGADRKYTNAKNPDFNADRVSGEELFNKDNYILRRDGKFLEFTEDEVRELAGQLPETQFWTNPMCYNCGEKPTCACEPSKVSDCCGAGKWRRCDDVEGCDLICSSCGEPCEAVEEKPAWATEEGKEKIKSVSHIFDRADKPDPIEPLDWENYKRYNETLSEFELSIDHKVDMLKDKQAEIIERLNSLSQHE